MITQSTSLTTCAPGGASLMKCAPVITRARILFPPWFCRSCLRARVRPWLVACLRSTASRQGLSPAFNFVMNAHMQTRGTTKCRTANLVAVVELLELLDLYARMRWDQCVCVRPRALPSCRNYMVKRIVVSETPICARNATSCTRYSRS